MSDRLAGDVAVVTGGGAGIGEATCLRFAAAGADVAVVDRDGEAANETARAVEERGRDALAVEADVSDEDAVAAMAERVADRFGGVDVLVNNAGVRAEPGPVTEATEESWDEVLDVNLKGTAFCSKHVVPLMYSDDASAGSSNDAAGGRECGGSESGGPVGSGREDGGRECGGREGGARDEGTDGAGRGGGDRGGDGRDGGAVVNVASVGANWARPGWSQYDATKGGIVSMTRDMACDHADQGIRVNAVSPGWVITDYHVGDRTGTDAERFVAEKTSRGGHDGNILERAAKPAELADAILFLASPASSFVTGVEIPVDGGASVV